MKWIKLHILCQQTNKKKFNKVQGPNSWTSLFGPNTNGHDGKKIGDAGSALQPQSLSMYVKSFET